jgi:hypothetical protein
LGAAGGALLTGDVGAEFVPHNVAAVDILLTDAAFTGGSVTAWGVIGGTTISRTAVAGRGTCHGRADYGPVICTAAFVGEILTNAVLHREITATGTRVFAAAGAFPCAVIGAGGHGFYGTTLSVSANGGAVQEAGDAVFIWIAFSISTHRATGTIKETDVRSDVDTGGIPLGVTAIGILITNAVFTTLVIAPDAGIELTAFSCACPA